MTCVLKYEFSIIWFKCITSYYSFKLTCADKKKIGRENVRKERQEEDDREE